MVDWLLKYGAFILKLLKEELLTFVTKFNADGERGSVRHKKLQR